MRLYYFAILWLKYDPTITITYCSFIETREIAIVGNIRLVRLLDLTADFGVETNAKLTPIFKLREQNWYSVSRKKTPVSQYFKNISDLLSDEGR